MNEWRQAIQIKIKNLLITSKVFVKKQQIYNNWTDIQITRKVFLAAMTAMVASVAVGWNRHIICFIFHKLGAENITLNTKRFLVHEQQRVNVILPYLGALQLLKKLFLCMTNIETIMTVLSFLHNK